MFELQFLLLQGLLLLLLLQLEYKSVYGMREVLRHTVRVFWMCSTQRTAALLNTTRECGSSAGRRRQLDVRRSRVSNAGRQMASWYRRHRQQRRNYIMRSLLNGAVIVISTR